MTNNLLIFILGTLPSAGSAKFQAARRKLNREGVKGSKTYHLPQREGNW
jgi:hypothetical protein